MRRKKPLAATIADPPEPAVTQADVDAEFIAAVRKAAAWMIAAGAPDPGLVTFVRIAANELERSYAARRGEPS